MNTMANSKSSLDLPDLLEAKPVSASRRISWNDIRYYLNLLMRFRWALIASFCLSMVVGLFLTATLPRLYQTDSTILIEPQKVPERYVQPTVPLDLDSRIASLSEQILSRSNLLDMINRFDLFPGPDSQSSLIDHKLESMRKQIKVERAGRQASSFKISFLYPNPDKGYAVVNRMTTFVIDQNLRMRESHAVGISDFLQDELAKMRTRLEEVEKALEEYHRTHMGELPEQLQSNLTILQRLQQQLDEKRQRLRDEMNARRALESQMKMTQQMSSLFLQTAPTQSPAAEPKSLEGLRERLAEYETRYTENHPDVVALKKKIEKLEKESLEGNKNPAAQNIETVVGPSDKLSIDLESKTLQEAFSRNTKAIEAEIANMEAQIKLYQQRVEDTPKREQELLALKRDYENIKGTYNSVLARKLEADIALNMEMKQKGEQFRILDPPRASTKPVSPNLNLIFLASIIAGLGIGGATVFLYELLDDSVRKPESLQSRLSLPVLMVMPAMEFMPNRRTDVLGWLNNGLSVVGVLVALGLSACLAAVTVLNLSQADEILKGMLK
jgi:polysaccharide chain length determinant protein (PEP-CTERM system associated)